jgi:UDP-3-O-[3-hydroxymyristoyl] glucosamine N-acyltransferase/predicted acyltransferase (DUF342 family)
MSWGSDTNANKFKKSYIQGFLDISGGNIIVESSSLIQVMSNEYAGQPALLIKPDRFSVFTGQSSYDISYETFAALGYLGTSYEYTTADIYNRIQFIASNTLDGNKTLIGSDASYTDLIVYGNVETRSNGNIIGAKNLLLTGDASLNQKLYVASNVRMDADLSVNQNLYVTGRSQLNNDVSMNRNVDIGTGNNSVAINKDISANIALDVSGATVFRGPVSINQDVSFNQALKVGTDLSVNRYLYVGNNALFNTDVSINQNLFVSGKTTIGRPPTSTAYELDLSGQQRIYEPTGTRATATVGSLVFEHGDASGVSSIVFLSKNNPGSDYAYIQYEENVGGASEKGVLTIGVENDAGSAGSSDRMSLYAAGGSGFIGVNTKNPLYSLDISGATNISNGTLFVSSDVSLNSKLFVNSDASLNKNLYVGQDLSVNRFLYVGSRTTIAGDASLNQNVKLGSGSNSVAINKDISSAYALDVSGATNLSNGPLFVSTDVSLNSKLFVNQDASLNKNLYIGQDVSINRFLYVGSRTVLNSDASLNQNVKLGSGNNSIAVNKDITNSAYALDISGATNLSNGPLFVSNDVSLNSKLFVQGDASLNRNLYIGQDVSINRFLYVGSRTVLNSDASLNQNVKLGSGSNSIAINKDTNSLYALDISGTTNLSNGPLFVSADVSLNSKLFIAQDASLNKNLYVGQDVSINRFLYVANRTVLNSDASLNQNVKLGSGNNSIAVNKDTNSAYAVDISGATNLSNGPLFVSSDVSFNNKLFVSKDASFNQNLLVGQDLSVNRFLYVNNATLFNGDVSTNQNLYVAGRGTFGRPSAAGTTYELDVSGQMRIYEQIGSNVISKTSVATLTLEHADASGASSIMFKSPSTTSNGDYAYIKYQDLSGATTNAGLLTIGVENNPTAANADKISIYAAGGSGYVGVNTLNPGYNLDVSGNANVSSTFYTNTIESLTSSSTLTIAGTNRTGTIAIGNSGTSFRIIEIGSSSATSGIMYLGAQAIRVRDTGNGSVSFGRIAGDATQDSTGVTLLSGVNTTGSVRIMDGTGSTGTVTIGKNSAIQITNSATTTVDVSATGLLTLRGSSLNVVGATRFNSDVSMNQNTRLGAGNNSVAVNKDISSQYALDVSGTTNLIGPLYTLGDVSLGQKLFVSGDVSVNTNLYVGRDVSINGNLYVANSVLLLNSDVSTNQNLYVAGRATFGRPPTSGTTYELDVSGQMRIYEQIGSNVISKTSVATLTLEHADASGASSIMFKSPSTTSNGDYAYIKYQDLSGATTNAGLLTIGVENNPTAATTRDRISLYAAGGSGFIGINTLDPSFNLDVSGNTNVSSSLFVNTIDPSNSASVMNIATTQTGGILNIGTGVRTSGSAAVNINNNVSSSGSTNIGGGSINITGTGNLTFTTTYSTAPSINIATSSRNGGTFNLGTGDPSGATTNVFSGNATNNAVLNIATGSRTAGSDINIANNTSSAETLNIGTGQNRTGTINMGTGSGGNKTIGIGGTLTTVNITGKSTTFTSDVSLNQNTRLGAGNNSVSVNKDISSNFALDISGATNFRGVISTLSDISVNGRLFTSGDVSLNQRLFVNGDASFNTNLLVGQDLSVNRFLYAANNALFNTDVSINQNLYVSGRMNIGRPPINTTYELDVSGQMRIYETVGTAASGNNGSLILEHGDASGVSSIVFRSKNNNPSDYGYLQYQENIGVGGISEKGLLTLGIENDAGAGGASDRISLYAAGGIGFVGVNTKDPSYHLDVSGSTRVTGNTILTLDVSLNRNAQIGAGSNSVSINKDISSNFALDISGATNFRGVISTLSDISINGRLFTSGDVSLNQKLFVSNDASLNQNLYIGQDLSVNRFLYVASKTVLNSDASLNQNVKLGSGNNAIAINKDTNSAYALDISGTTNLSNGPLFVFGDVSLNSKLFVAQDASLNLNLYVGQDVSINRSLYVANSALFNSDISTNQNLYVAGKATFGRPSATGTYELDISGTMRILEGAGTSASTTTGSLILEHTAVGGTSSIMFKGPNTTTNDYAYVQYTDASSVVQSPLKFDLSTNSPTTILLDASLPSTGTNTTTQLLFRGSTFAWISGSSVSAPASAQYCLSFNQTNVTFADTTSPINYLQLAPPSNNLSSFTFSAWIRPTQFPDSQSFFMIANLTNSSSDGTIDIMMNPNGGINVLFSDDSTNYIYSNGDTLLNAWSHLVFTFDEKLKNGYLYINGSLSTVPNSSGLSGKSISANNSLLVGLKWGWNNGSGTNSTYGTTSKFKGFRGQMAFINVFDKSLSASDIAYLYNNPAYNVATNPERGMLTIGIENETGVINNDRIVLWPGAGTGNIGINTKTPSTTLDISGTMRIFEGAGTTASTGAGSLILEHTAVGGTSSIMFKGPNTTTSDYAYVQYTDALSSVQSLLKYDLSINSPSDISGVVSTGTSANTLIQQLSDSSLVWFNYGASGLPAINTVVTPAYCVSFNQTNLNTVTQTTLNVPRINSLYTSTGYNSDFTFSVWVRPSGIDISQSTAGRYYIMYAAASGTSGTGVIEIYIEINSDINKKGKVYCFINSDGTNRQLSNVAITLNAWNHICFSFSSTNKNGQLYLNNVPAVNEGTGLTGKTINSYDKMWLGVAYNSVQAIFKGFRGLMAFVNFFDKALTASDIAYLYYNPAYNVATNPERGLLTIGVENDTGIINNDRIVLWPGAGTGYVGINTRTPTATLDVSGTVQAVSYNATSDYRLKENVSPLDSLFNVDKLSPVTYTLKGSGKQDIGFIAHEVQELYPFLVNGVKDGPNTQSINYNGFIGILTKEIKDLKAKVQEQEERFTLQEARLETMEKLLLNK